MAKARKGRHAKRKGPGGPKRTSRTASSEAFVPSLVGVPAMPFDPSIAPQTESLVDSLLDTIVPADGMEPIQLALSVEQTAGEFLATLEESAGPAVDPMSRDLARALARRRSPAADQMLAALTTVGLGKPAFQDVWDRRRTEGVDDPVALAIGDDTPMAVWEVSHESGDGITLLLAVDNPLGAYTAAVYIDHNLGGIAKDLFVGPPISEALATYKEAGEGFALKALTLDEASSRAQRAFDASLGSPELLDDTFLDELPIVAARFDLLPCADQPAVDPEPLSVAERMAHLGAFLTSPEASALEEPVAELAPEIIGLWIDHAVEETIGGPRRVSGVLVELFCLIDAEHEIATDPELAAAARPVVEAWLRFAARTTGVHHSTLDDALAALDRFGPVMEGHPVDFGFSGLHESRIGGAHLGDEDDVSIPLLHGLAGDPTTWRPLEQAPAGGHLRATVDPSTVPDDERGRTGFIASYGSAEAARLLGPSFAQPAMELAVRLGSADPCPFRSTQLRTWFGTIVWVLAEDSDGFEKATVGRRRDDLAGALPMTRATYESKAKRVREVLGLARGDLHVAHDRAP